MRVIRFALSLPVLLLVFLWPAQAQTAGSGALSIAITDPTGAVVPGAEITVTSIATGASRVQTTGENGSAQFMILQPGLYHVTVTAQGFKIVEIPSATVNVAETHVLNQRLELGAAQEQVTVSTSAEAMQIEASALGGVVGAREIGQLPLVTRNYTQIMGLSPGAVMDVNNAAVGRGSQYVHVNGSTNVNNNFQMDGRADVPQLHRTCDWRRRGETDG